MHQRTIPITRMLFMLALAVIVFAVLALIIGINRPPLIVTAQEPLEGDDLPFIPFDQETLARHGLSIEAIQAASNSFDLKVTKTANASSVNSGDPIAFTITIHNKVGSDPAPYVFFKDDYPSQMQNVEYLFSTAAVSNGLSNPTWWVFTDPIPANGTVVATVTGRLVSGSSVTVKNEATASAAGELNSSDNTDEVNVRIESGGPGQYTIFLPMIHRNPLLFYDDFSDDESGWPEYDVSGCEVTYHENDEEYRILAESDETCFGPAPPAAEYYFGKFQVSARVSSGEDSYVYGIYINGKGGDDYYLFRIRPNDDCGWNLIRREDGDNSVVASGGCHSAINRGKLKNILRIEHSQSGTMSVYINNERIFTGNQNWFPGKGAGVYVEADNNKDVTVRFDDFTVLEP